MTDRYEVLSPVGEAEIPEPRRNAPRLDRLEGRVVGLFENNKRAAPGILEVVERELRARVPGVRFSRFRHPHNRELLGEELLAFRRWVAEVDAVVGAVGD
ncbi:MAG: hypothetical protein QN172_09255 [Armatimonadota bacterium]|nr:hypothetical protein [Armatimonadota bacterium]MDR7438576.1 hypothetical protein [Armatimonadota bacterium]MDR7563756.1 hypothetical protein [Armatimonadota bacterium]MDR7567363.1 hypothetical protein [Armatimonadota bacterium]MDR7602628.1 hypothetical protein [Armatimonadota bacterium]